MTQVFTLIWFLIAPVCDGCTPKDQSVYFNNRLSSDECFQMKRRLDEFTTVMPNVVESRVICVPVPRS